MECRQADLFKVFSVESRIRIIELLKLRGPLGVNEMAKALSITPSAVSQHLKVLRYAGLVRNERKGYWLPYEIDHAGMARGRELVADVCNCGCKGSCRAQRSESGEIKDPLVLLKKRERELRKELQEVRARIQQARTKE